MLWRENDPGDCQVLIIEQTRRTALWGGGEKHEGFMIETLWTSNTGDLFSPDAAAPFAKTKSTACEPGAF